MMFFKRDIEKSLYEWKGKENRKPLIIRGARQVGKTTLINQFAKTYKNYIYLNLEKPVDKDIFEQGKDLKTITESLFLRKNISIDDSVNTLLFIDEIQESSRAIGLLRYFYEDFPSLHVIAAGSLIEFAFRHIKNFPVGRVEFAYLFPFNFGEFLLAGGNTELLRHLQKIPVSEAAHPLLLDLFKIYAILGGMPEIVRLFITKDSFTDLPVVYESLWESFRSDVEKYAQNDTERKVIKHIISTAHLFVDQRIKFQNFGNSPYRSREVGEAFRQLDAAKLIQLIYPTTDVSLPIRADIKKSPRVQFLDNGLLNHNLGIQADMLNMDDLNYAYKGSIIPHIIIQEIISLQNFSYHKPHFWVREKTQSSAEVDLVIVSGDKAVPVEIKSGPTGTLRSLHQFIERSPHPYAVRIYANSFKVERHKTPGGREFLLMNIPYYLGTQLRKYIDYFVSEFKL
jgi:uncharacterized protein